MTAPSPHLRGSGPTQEEFDNLLRFLASTREEAARKYEDIRRRLIKILVCRGSTTPEELVDETMDRIARKAALLAGSYVGDPALYCYGVARRVFLESVKKRPGGVPPPPQPAPSGEKERESACLERCLESLSPRQSKLIREYYREDKSAKIDNRRALAERMGVGLNALRIQAHRIRAHLLKCVSLCLERDDEILPPRLARMSSSTSL